MAKGIRVNQLAKELGIESKSILAKCRDEGLGDKVPNHMSVLSVGLAETVREWFHSGELSADGGGGTAVETAAPVDVAVKTKRARPKPKKEVETLEAPEAEALVEEPPAPPTFTAAPSVPAACPPPPVVAEAPAAPQGAAAPEFPPAPAAEVAPLRPPERAPRKAPSAPEPVAPAAHAPATAPPLAAAASAPVAPPPAPAKPPVEPGKPPISRPTITLRNRGTGPAVVERKSVTPAPRLVVPEPAKIQGPRVVREEQPDNLPTPRRRPTPGGATEGPAFAQARPLAGRGVKVSEGR